MITEDITALLGKQEELCEELQAYYEPGGKGDWPTVRHPLVYSIPHTEQMNAMLNERLRCLKKRVAEHKAKRDWSAYFMFHERPYRLEAFVGVMKKMSDTAYWKNLSWLWRDTENSWQNLAAWSLLFQAKRPRREKLMTKSERVNVAKLGPVIRVYRGCISLNRRGLSWTTDHAKAKFFAKRLLREGQTGIVLHGEVATEDVLAFFEQRGESEIVTLNKSVRIVREELV